MPKKTNYLPDQRIEEFLKLKRTRSTQSIYRGGLRHFINYYKAKHGENTDFNHFLNRIFEEFKKPLQERRRIIEPELAGFIDYLKEKGYANKTIRAWLAAVQNYLKYNHITVSMSFVGNLPQPTSLKVNEKHEWTLEQVKQFVDHAKNFRDKAIILCLFQSGVGINELLSLNYGDVREELEKETIPLHLKLVRKKTGVEFRTFFGRDAVHYLKSYLKTRMQLKDGSPLFTKWGSETERLTRDAVEKKFREIAETVPFIKKDKLDSGYNPARPHSLRAAFRSRLTGKTADSLIEFWMGHSMGEQVRAYINLPTEELRELYMDAEKYLATEKTSREELEERRSIPVEIDQSIEERIRKKALIDFAKLQGFSPEKISQLKEILAKSKSVEESLETFAKLEDREKHDDPRKIVTEKELEDHLTEGWEVVSILPSKRIIVKKAAG